LPSNEGQAQGVSGDGASAAAGPTSAFGETSNPAEYVPREATEEALLALEGAVRSGRCAALTSPPGLGKSLLLRLLDRWLAPDYLCLFLPYGALPVEELCAWALGLLEQPTGDNARRELLRFARLSAAEGRILVLLIDDGSSMPLETARGVGDLVRESGNRIHVVLGASDDATSSRVISALHPEIVEVRLAEPMTAMETRLYVHTRLEQAGVPPELRSRFHEETIGWIHRLSGGVPRRVHDLAASLLDEPPEGVGSKWREERWLGAPIGSVESDGDPLLADLPPLPEILGKRPPLEIREDDLDDFEADDDIDLL
jgi:type II secretory pathway predicted ATPase ExeA